MCWNQQFFLTPFLVMGSFKWGFPRSSAGKESAYNAGGLGSIPGSGRSPGEGIGYPLQCSWASLVVQMVKNLPSTWEAWVWSLSLEDPLEEGMAIHSSILAWRIPMDRGAWWTTVHGVTKSQTRLRDSAQHSFKWPQWEHLHHGNWQRLQISLPSPHRVDTWVPPLGWEDPLEKERATHSSTLAWKMPWMEVPGRLQLMGSQSCTWLSNFTSPHYMTRPLEDGHHVRFDFWVLLCHWLRARHRVGAW